MELHLYDYEKGSMSSLLQILSARICYACSRSEVSNVIITGNPMLLFIHTGKEIIESGMFYFDRDLYYSGYNGFGGMSLLMLVSKTPYSPCVSASS